MSEDEARTYRVVDAFWKQVWRRGKDKEQSNHKSKIVAKVFASSDSAKHSPKKKSIATASGVMTCATCGKESKTWRKLKQHVIGRHLSDKLVDHYSFNANEKSFSCEYGQECVVQRRNKSDIMMHLHCKHQVVTEQQVLEIANKAQVIDETDNAGDGQDSAKVTSPETVAAMNRQECEVKMFNILEGVDHPSDVSDISNYSMLRKPRRHRLPSTSDVGTGEKSEERSPLQGSKRWKKPAKEKKEGKSAEQLPALFTCPLVLKSQSSSATSFTIPSTSTSEPACTEAACKRSSTPKPSPKSMQEKSIGRDGAEFDLGEVMNPAHSPADEEELMKDEDSANDGVYTCRSAIIVWLAG